MLRKVVVEAHRVTLRIAEKFTNSACREWRNVLHRRRLGRRRRYHDAVFHRAIVRQDLHDLRDGRTLLSDRAINTNHVAAALVDDRVQNDGGLSRLPVSNDQLALSAPDRNHRVNGLDSRLHRLAHRLPVNHARRQTLQRIPLIRLNGSLIVYRVSQRVYHAPEHRIAHRHGHNFIRPLDDVSFFDLCVVSQQHYAHLIFFQVQRDSENVIRKREHLARHAFIQPVNARNSVADRDHRSHFVNRQRLLIVLDLLAQYFCNLVRFDVCHSRS